eukprot:scaffold182804_cov20-Tisochrysis_lutea.AAC.1
MPGMMNTVLDLGLCDANVEGLASKYGKRFAYDCYRRLLAMFGDVVYNIPGEEFEQQIEVTKKEQKVTQDIELTAESLNKLIKRTKWTASKSECRKLGLGHPSSLLSYAVLGTTCAAFLILQEVFSKHGKSLPQDPWEQLVQSISAVFLSYNTPRAIKYRGEGAVLIRPTITASTKWQPAHLRPKLELRHLICMATYKINKITSIKGTAANVQSMGACLAGGHAPAFKCTNFANFCMLSPFPGCYT